MDTKIHQCSNSEQPLSRKQFLDLVAPSLVVGGFLIREALETPEFDDKDPTESYVPSMYDLSFIERSSGVSRPPFISLNMGGHRDYVRHVVSNKKEVQDSIVAGYQKMLDGDPERISFESAISTHLHSAHRYLSESEEFGDLPPYYKAHQCISYAIYSMVSQFSSWFKMHELREMGVVFPDRFRRPDQYGVAPEKMLWKLLPPIFPTDFDHTIREGSHAHLLLASGSDRAVHFMNHFFVSSRFLSLLESGNQDARRIPNGLRALIYGLSPYDKAMRISMIAGYAWEFKEFYNSPYNYEEEKIPEGIHDPVVELDYKANELGAMFAISLHKYLKQNAEKDFETLMNDIVKLFGMLDSGPYAKADRVLSRNLETGRYYTTPLLVP